MLKCESFVIVIPFSSEKVVLSESGEKYTQIKHCLQVKTVQNSTKQICKWILMWEDNRWWTFSLEEVLLWFMDSYFGQKQLFKPPPLALVYHGLLIIPIHLIGSISPSSPPVAGVWWAHWRRCPVAAVASSKWMLHTGGGWGENPHMIVKRFGCMAIHNKALYKCIIHHSSYDVFVSYKHTAFCFTRHYLMDWGCVDYLWIIVMFLSAHSDGTHSLQRIHWQTNDLKLNFYKSVLIKKQLIYILDGLRASTFLANVHFWVNILLILPLSEHPKWFSSRLQNSNLCAALHISMYSHVNFFQSNFLGMSSWSYSDQAFCHKQVNLLTLVNLRGTLLYLACKYKLALCDSLKSFIFI